MKVHLRQIPADGLHLAGEEEGDILELPADEDARLLGPVRYALELGLDTAGMWATGELRCEAELRCVRCLEWFRFPVHVPDIAWHLERPANEMVNLTPALREDILLALPAYPHCDWSGERICPGRQETAADPAASLDVEGGAAARSLAAWATLDQLKPPSKPISPA